MIGLLSLLLLSISPTSWDLDANFSIYTFFISNRPHLENLIQETMDERKAKLIFIIQFDPNDFGRNQEVDTEWYHYPVPTPSELARDPKPARWKKLTSTKLLDDERSIAFQLYNDDSAHLLSLRYRHASEKKALKTVSRLFGCENGSSELLNETLIIGIGSSHGATALRNFHHQLPALCGKGMDIAFIGDGIVRPLHFSMRRFESQNAPYKLKELFNFYEQDTFYLHGTKIRDAQNILITSSNHNRVSIDLPQFTRKFLEDLCFLNGRITPTPYNDFELALMEARNEYRAKQALIVKKPQPKLRYNKF